MHLYDTRAKAAVAIVPATPGLLRIYACGPTVYRDAHVGNMRTFLLTDLIRRVAELEGLQTVLVQNITDVGHMADDTGLGANAADGGGGDGGGAGDAGGIDEGQGDGEDKVLAQAAKEGQGALQVARHYEDAFHRDCAALNIRPADHYPRASESVDQMITLITTLLERGHAYLGGEGSVFFDAQSCPDYGALSGNRLDQLKPGYRYEGGVDPAKRFHADWALWKHASETRTQLVWDTPWGRGFPGWHTECSAMSLDLLGEVIDIHTGGIDLRFPHHEDERAQSNGVTGTEVVQHWIHGEHLLFEGRKMSKSSGNVVLVSDVAERGLDPLALRLAFLQHRHRQQMNLTWEVLTSADSTITRWRTKVAAWAQSPSAAMPQDARHRFEEAVSDDLDLPRALQVVREVEKDNTLSEGARMEFFLFVDRILGLDLARDIGKVVEEIPVPSEVTTLVAARAAAREARDWAASDELRDAISALGWSVRDTADGQEVEQA